MARKVNRPYHLSDIVYNSGGFRFSVGQRGREQREVRERGWRRGGRGIVKEERERVEAGLEGLLKRGGGAYMDVSYNAYRQENIIEPR